MYITEPVANFSGFGDAQRALPIGNIQFVEAAISPVSSGGRVKVNARTTGVMSREKCARFIQRFMDPMRNHDLAFSLLAKINADSHPLMIAWSHGNFPLTGTLAADRIAATNGTGSAALIFIDEDGQDWKKLKTIAANPDVGLFHELVHARCIQRGVMVEDEKEMENRVIGLGKYQNARCTENGYREDRNLNRRCCHDREDL